MVLNEFKKEESRKMGRVLKCTNVADPGHLRSLSDLSYLPIKLSSKSIVPPPPPSPHFSHFYFFFCPKADYTVLISPSPMHNPNLNKLHIGLGCITDNLVNSVMFWFILLDKCFIGQT